MKLRNSLWVFVPLAVFIGLALLLASGLGRDTEWLPTALKGKPVPDFTLPSLNQSGRTITPAIFKGHWTLLNVWASWCPTCHEEHPFLMQLARDGVRIVGLNYKDEKKAASEYLAQLGNPYIAIAMDKTGDVGLNLGVYGAPETFIINPRGRVVLRRVGNLDPRVWREKIAPVWKGPQPALQPASGQGQGQGESNDG